MRKTIAILLACLMLLTFTACGKSEATKNVEAAISAIGEVTLESGNSINAAQQAYDALTDKEKEQVENINLLAEAKSALANLEKLEAERIEAERLEAERLEAERIEAEYVQKRNALIAAIHTINEFSDYTSGEILKMWNNVINSKSSLDFSAVYGSLVFMTFDGTVDEYMAKYDKQFELFIHAAGLAVAPDITPVSALTDMSVDTMNKIIKLCYEYNHNISLLQTSLEELDEIMAEYKTCVSDDHKDEYELLSEWYVETKSYAEFASAPTGNYTSYSNNRSNYQSEMGKYQTKASLLG